MPENILLQCIGCYDDVTPIFSYGSVDRNCTYMLCSDGFRHRISMWEMYQFLKLKSLNPYLINAIFY